MHALRVAVPDVGGHRRAVALAIAAPVAPARVPQTALIIRLHRNHVVARVEGGFPQQFAGCLRLHGPVGVDDARVDGVLLGSGARKVNLPREAEVVDVRHQLSCKCYFCLFLVMSR